MKFDLKTPEGRRAYVQDMRKKVKTVTQELNSARDFIFGMQRAASAAVMKAQEERLIEMLKGDPSHAGDYADRIKAVLGSLRAHLGSIAVEVGADALALTREAQVLTPLCKEVFARFTLLCDKGVAFAQLEDAAAVFSALDDSNMEKYGSKEATVVKAGIQRETQRRVEDLRAELACC